MACDTFYHTDAFGDQFSLAKIGQKNPDTIMNFLDFLEVFYMMETYLLHILWNPSPKSSQHSTKNNSKPSRLSTAACSSLRDHEAEKHSSSLHELPIFLQRRTTSHPIFSAWLLQKMRLAICGIVLRRWYDRMRIGSQYILFIALVMRS